MIEARVQSRRSPARVFDHVTIRVSDRDASRRFYDCVLAPLGHRLTHPGEHFDEWHDFGIAQADSTVP